ncbi:MAG: ParA family protein [Anaerolineaceae bacterium]|nr:ParA family protein [Anaerolineaceae bacterium]
MTYIISIANEKGGVAKTTTTLSLGAALAETGLEILLVDLDAQSNLSLAVNAENNPSLPTMANVILEGLPARSALRETQIPRLKIIPSNAELGLAERFLPIRQAYETTRSRAFRDINWEFDFIIMDCPPFLGAVSYNAMMASDLLLMPTQAEYFSINALRNMMGLIRRIRVQGNPRLTYRLLLTMFDRRNRIHRSMTEQLRSTFGGGVLETVIEIDTKLRESPIAGVPILVHAPKSRSALQYRALAQEILTYVKETASQPD